MRTERLDATKAKHRDPETDLSFCYVCKTGEHVELITMPYVLKYLAAELASVNIKMKMEFK